jgi:hypothetical protein
MVGGGAGPARKGHSAEVKRTIGVRLYNRAMNLAEMWTVFWSMVGGVAIVHFFPRRALWEQIALAMIFTAVASLLASLS